MDYSRRTAQECREDYELHGVTVRINDGKVSRDASPADGAWDAVKVALGSGNIRALESDNICIGGKVPLPGGAVGIVLRAAKGNIVK